MSEQEQEQEQEQELQVRPYDQVGSVRGRVKVWSQGVRGLAGQGDKVRKGLLLSVFCLLRQVRLGSCQLFPECFRCVRSFVRQEVGKVR